MKLKKEIVLIATLISCQLKAQSLSDLTPLNSPGYWNLSYSIGIGKDIISNEYTQTPSNGFTYSIDASYTPENIIGFFTNYSVTNLNGSIDNNNYDYRHFSDRGYNFSQLSVGPRFFTSDKIFFIDAGLRYYSVVDKEFIGLNAGAGAKIKFSDSYGILINGRIHNTFVQNGSYPQKKEPFVYYGIYVGMELNNSKDKTVIDYKKNEFAIAALGGSFSSGINFRYAGGTFGAELSYDISSKVSVLFDYFYSQSELNNSYSIGAITFNEKTYDTGRDFNAGVRLYLLGNSFRVFAESAVNMYFWESIDESSNIYYHSKNKTANNYIGINFGGGVDFKLVDKLSGIFKMNLGTYIVKGSSYNGIYGGLKFGI